MIEAIVEKSVVAFIMTEDKKVMPNPTDEEQFLEDFNEMYNK